MGKTQQGMLLRFSVIASSHLTARFTGTWSSRSNLPAEGLFPVPRSASPTLSELQAATLGINPPTAYRMLKDYELLKKGDWVVQNGGNSQVGLAVIQLAKEWGLSTINFVRDR